MTDGPAAAAAHPPVTATKTEMFGGLTLTTGPGILAPRPWTIVQSEWAADIAAELPDGPLLELCTGCGLIGLEAARRTGRAAVLVDA